MKTHAPEAEVKECTRARRRRGVAFGFSTDHIESAQEEFYAGFWGNVSARGGIVRPRQCRDVCADVCQRVD